MAAPFLVLQVRPETAAADEEYAAILARGGLAEHEVVRVRLELEPDTRSLALEDFAATIVGGGPGCVSDSPAEQPPLERGMQAAVLALMGRITAGGPPVSRLLLRDRRARPPPRRPGLQGALLGTGRGERLAS